MTESDEIPFGYAMMTSSVSTLNLILDNWDDFDIEWNKRVIEELLAASLVDMAALQPEWIGK